MKYTFVLSCILLTSSVPLFSQQLDTIRVACNKNSIKEFSRSIQMAGPVRCIRFIGYQEDMNWDKALSALQHTTSLEEIIFDSNGLETLPDALKNLKQLQHLTVFGNHDMDIESGILILQQLPLLQSIQIELYSTDELPYEISSLKKLERVTIVSTAFEDQRMNAEAAMTHKKSVHFKYDLPIRESGETTRKIMVEFISPEKIEFVAPNFTFSNDTESFKDVKFPFQRGRRIDPPQNPYEKNYSSFRPAFKSVDVPKAYYAVRCNTKTVISSDESGSQIIVPENAFVDSNGNPVVGEVVVDYREFRDAADFILSGIPMSFSEGDQHSFFQSAGMFEINASQNGNEVFLQEGKSIQVNFVATDSSNTYDFFSYQDADNSWVNKGPASPAKLEDLVTLQDITIAYQYYKQNIGLSFTRGFVDTTTFSERFENPRYSYTHVVNKADSKSKWFDLIFRSSRGSVFLKRARKTAEQEIIFSLEYYANLNPELNAIRTRYWQLLSNISMTEFKTDYCRKRTYSDVRVEKLGDNYKIRLKHKDGICEITAKPVECKVNEKGKTIYVDKVVRFKGYERSLKNREKKFDKGILREAQRINNQKPRSAKDVWMNLQSLMTEEEKAMNFEMWNEYCDSLDVLCRTSEAKVAANELSVTRSLSLSGFGIFNCDQILRLREPVPVIAHYETPTRKVKSECTYVIDKNINAILTYNRKRGYNYNPDSFVVDPKSSMSIVIIDANGKVGVVDQDQLESLDFNEDEPITFQVDMDDTPISVADFRKKIGMDN